MKHRYQARYEMIEVPFGGMAIWDCSHNRPAEINGDHLSGLRPDVAATALLSLNGNRASFSRGDRPGR